MPPPHQATIEMTSLQTQKLRQRVKQRFCDENGLILTSLSFLDVPTLIHIKQVSKLWQTLCDKAIQAKCPNPKKFETNKELRTAVVLYCSNIPSAIEFIAYVYGYPINKWQVQKLKDFSFVFQNMDGFNGYIGDWDVSNATTMESMFDYASSFNQPLNNWDPSSVTDMTRMFGGATKFNQPLHNWDTSSVVHLAYTFRRATSFKQPLDRWNISSVRFMSMDVEDLLPDGSDTSLVIGWYWWVWQSFWTAKISALRGPSVFVGATFGFSTKS